MPVVDANQRKARLLKLFIVCASLNNCFQFGILLLKGLFVSWSIEDTFTWWNQNISNVQLQKVHRLKFQTTKSLL